MRTDFLPYQRVFRTGLRFGDLGQVHLVRQKQNTICLDAKRPRKQACEHGERVNENESFKNKLNLYVGWRTIMGGFYLCARP